MNKTSTLIIKLFVIAAVAALVLAATNMATAPVISQRQEEEFKKSFTEAYPDGKEFKSVETKVNENLEEVIEVSDGSNTVGYVFKGIAKGGYGGDISYIMGVNNDGVIQGFKPLTHSETQGYGSKMTEPEFIDGVKEVNIAKGVSYGSGNKETGEIQQISGATRTTSALTNSFYEVAKKMGDLSENIEPLGDVVVPYFADKYADIYPEADKFKEVKNDFKQEQLVRIVDAFKGEEILGHIIQLKATGYGGDIDLLLGVNKDKKIEQFKVVRHNETEYLGAEIDNEIYQNNVVGKSLASKIKLKAQPKRDKDILLISGATVTSMAMQDAMNSAVNGLAEYGKATIEYEDLDVDKIVADANKEAEDKKAAEEAKAQEEVSSRDYTTLFEGVKSVEPAGQDLLNDNVVAINKTDAGDYIIDVNAAGFIDTISAGILVSPDGTIKDFKFYEINESDGFGAVAAEQAYIDKLMKQNLKDATEFKATKEGTGQGEIQDISGATGSTSGMKEIMSKAAEAFKGLN